MLKLNVEKVHCAVCYKYFYRRLKKTRLRWTYNVRRYGGKTCSKKCAREYTTICARQYSITQYKKRQQRKANVRQLKGLINNHRSDSISSNGYAGLQPTFPIKCPTTSLSPISFGKKGDTTGLAGLIPPLFSFQSSCLISCELLTERFI